MSTDAGGSLPNRAHYLRAAVIGGAVSALLSVIPIISWLNFFFGCLIVAGGVLSAQQLQAKTGTVEPMEGGVVGALSGFVCGMIIFALFSCLMTVFGAVLLPDAGHRTTEEFLTFCAAVLGGSCCFTIIGYPVLGGIGGVIGTFIWPAQNATTGAPGPGPAGTGPTGPSPEAVAKRQKMIRIVLGSVGGCFAVMVGICGFLGYLAYLEERDPDDTAGQAAIAEANVVVGTTTLVEIPGTGSYASARYGVWLVADDDLPPSMYTVDGRLGCAEVRPYGSNETYMRDIYSYRGPDSGEPSWLFLDSEYMYGGYPVRCEILINTLPAGVQNPRIVVTRLERPSDWFD